MKFALAIASTAFASVFASSAHATSLTCSYLTQGSGGAPYPGLARPQVTVVGNYANVELVMEAGRGTVSRVNYTLTAERRTRNTTRYADASHQAYLVLTAKGKAALNVKGLVASCN